MVGLNLQKMFESHLKGFDKLLALIIPNMDVAVIEGDKHPLLGRVEVA